MITDAQLHEWAKQAPPETVKLIEEVLRCRKELDRAWRCISGFHHFRARGQLMTDAAFGYHSMTVAGAARYVNSHREAQEGSEYFLGKDVNVLHEALAVTK